MPTLGKLSRILTSLLLAVILAVGITMISPRVTHAAANLSCSGTGCNGHDPYRYNCTSGAYAMLSKSMYDQAGNYDGTAQIWWSPGCQTNWGRVVMNTNNTDPWCAVLPTNQCWYKISASMWLLGFNSSGYYNGQETYLPLSTDGPDYCDHNCGGSTIFYGNMYYAPTAEVLVEGWAGSEYNDNTLNPPTPDYARGCIYTGASWKYANQKPACP